MDIWSQHNGAAPHFGNDIINLLLQKFTGQIISLTLIRHQDNKPKIKFLEINANHMLY